MVTNQYRGKGVEMETASWKVPRIVDVEKAISITQPAHRKYVEKINKIIVQLMVKDGEHAKQETTCMKDGFRFSYIRNPYGNDHFQIEVHKSVWNDIP